AEEAEALYEKAAKYVQGGPETPTATAEAPAPRAGPAPSNVAAAPTGPPAAPPPPPPASSAGYNAYKDAKQAFVDGCAHFRKAKSGGRAELVAAQKSFDKAMASYSEADRLGHNDPHMSEFLNDLTQFRKECRTL